MATLDRAKRIGAGFSNSAQRVKVTYDFSVDTGGVADYIMLTADSDCIVELEKIFVETACTSDGSMVLDLGVGAGGTEFLSNTAVSSLSLNAIINADTVGTKVRVAADGTIQMGIEVAALTAGKFHAYFIVTPEA